VGSATRLPGADRGDHAHAVIPEVSFSVSQRVSETGPDDKEDLGRFQQGAFCTAASER